MNTVFFLLFYYSFTMLFIYFFCLQYNTQREFDFDEDFTDEDEEPQEDIIENDMLSFI